MTAPAGLAPFFHLTGTILDPSTGEPLLGTVTFTPTVKALLVAGAPKPFTALPQPTIVQLDRDGDLAVAGVKQVNLVATNDPATNPTGNWTYTVSFSLRNIHGKTVKLDSYSIAAPSGQTKNLTEVAQVSPGGGAPITVGPPNVLAIGTVTTTAPGTSATASLTGTSPSQVLNLSIPRGTDVSSMTAIAFAIAL